jgi:hypothetical protein
MLTAAVADPPAEAHTYTPESPGCASAMRSTAPSTEAEKGSLAPRRVQVTPVEAEQVRRTSWPG